MEILGLILAIYFGVRAIITGAEIGIFMNPELSKTVIDEIMTPGARDVQEDLQQ